MSVRKEQLSENVTLYLGDCREILPTLGRFDACVTDPPYGIGADRAMFKAGGTKYGAALVAKRHYQDTNWDTEIPSDDTIALILALAKWHIWFGGNFFPLPPSRCWLVWDKKINGEFAACELAWTNLDKPVKRIEWMWNGMLRKGSDERSHPTQKPLGVMSWCLEHLPANVQTVIDPYCGSGTTGVACVGKGLGFTGIEREVHHFDTACRRISDELRRPRLFADPVAKPVQEALL
jgi:DNA modification methylase